MKLRASSGERTVPMERAKRGYYRAVINGVQPGTAYTYVMERAGEDARGPRAGRSKSASRAGWRETPALQQDETVRNPQSATCPGAVGIRNPQLIERPDPASLSQPEGVHGVSRVVDTSSFEWDDGEWRGVPLGDYVIYELHVGAFTPEGTFDAVIPRLAELRRLGVTAIEFMPIAQFPGSRNWGYDGVYPYAAQESYGGPEGFARLVNAAHREGLAVVLDVVYNHLGPEGNYLDDFGPYHTARYRTPWGQAINFDGPGSDEVRRYFIENALFWMTDFHVDALRLDAIHGIFDSSARPFLADLAGAVHRRGAALGRPLYVIAESDLNDPKVVVPPPAGHGLDAQWSDDFHHAIHALLTGERQGYYVDFGEMRHLAAAFEHAFVYTGQYSEFRGKRHGAPPPGAGGRRFVVASQTHDQVGNRMKGERLAALVSFEALKLAAGTVMVSPFLPLLFMGEEYGETAPFLYFTSHSDAALIEAVRKGRQEGFQALAWEGQAPPPDAEKTFWDSKLRWDLRERAEHRVLLDFYRELLRLRRGLPALAHLSTRDMQVTAFDTARCLVVRRWKGEETALAIASFSGRESEIVPGDLAAHHAWCKVLDSAEPRWAGSGSHLPPALGSSAAAGLRLAPFQFVLFAAGPPTWSPPQSLRVDERG